MERIARGLDFCVRSVPPTIPESGRDGWRRLGLFEVATRILARLECHISHLAAGAIPHPPHRHEDEELLIPLSGGIEVILEDASVGAGGTGPRVEPGRMVFLPSELGHTHRAFGPDGAVYLVFRWRGSAPGEGRPSNQPVILEAGTSPGLGETTAPGNVELSAFGDVACRGIGSLKAHHTRMADGAELPGHSDAHDLVLVLLRGSLETSLGTVSAPTLLFYRAGVEHWHRQSGRAFASYLALEFHGERP